MNINKIKFSLPSLSSSSWRRAFAFSTTSNDSPNRIDEWSEKIVPHASEPTAVQTSLNIEMPTLFNELTLNEKRESIQMLINELKEKRPYFPQDLVEKHRAHLDECQSYNEVKTILR